MGTSRKLPAAGLRPLAVVSLGMLLFISARAQSSSPSDSDGDEHNTTLRHVPSIPQTPADYHPITPEQRLKWFVRATAGPKSLVGGLFSAGFGTATDNPHEYGTHWVGFGQRYGMRLTGVSTGNAIEAGLGSAWGEDPRYFHTVGQPFSARVSNIFDLTFRAYRADGKRHPAYARYIAIFGNNFLSNSWRAPSEADWQHALVRSGEGFGAHFLSNAFNEFAPLVWKKIRHRSDSYSADADGP